MTLFVKSKCSMSFTLENECTNFKCLIVYYLGLVNKIVYKKKVQSLKITIFYHK